MARVHNFSAGPAALPTSVLAEIADEMMDYRGRGMSVLEMSHRSSMYQQIIDDAEATLRRLLSIPDNYRVLFLQGGATLQFAGIPMNLMRRGRAGYVVTGNFANKAYKEAAKYGEAVPLASSEDTNFDRIPNMADINARIADEAAGDGLDYVYICQNNTIFGTQYVEVPQVEGVPLVADMSSMILSKPVDVTKYGCIYFGVQKNVAPAGMAIAIIRDDLLGKSAKGIPAEKIPTMMNYTTLLDKDSMYNTPPCWCIYILGLVLAWLERQGGVEGMQQLKHARAAKVYDFLDNSALFHPCAQPGSRSDMNVTFRTGDDALDKEFISGAAARGLLNLKGHRVAGGMRASLYNAMPMAGVDALVDYLKQFEVEHHV